MRQYYQTSTNSCSSNYMLPKTPPLSTKAKGQGKRLSALSTDKTHKIETIAYTHRANTMALLSLPPLTALSPLPSSSLSSSLSINAAPVSRLLLKSIDLQPKAFAGFQIVTSLTKNRRTTLIVKASEGTDVVGPTEGGEPPSETPTAVVPVDQLPLESKEKERMEQKLRMKLAKKIRLRRKRLLRKRKLRKKGSWPPSKMKKLKNI